MRCKVRISPLAANDLNDIKEYIAGDNPHAAAKLVNILLAVIKKLAHFPKLGSPLSSKINIQTDYRYLVCETYLIFYKIEGEYISVYRVLNGARDYLSILFADDLPKGEG